MRGLTITQISDELGERRHRVDYALRKLAIAPLTRVGQTDIYPPVALTAVRECLRMQATVSAPHTGLSKAGIMS